MLCCNGIKISCNMSVVVMQNSILMSVSDIISVLGGNSAFARAIGVGASTASEMKRRGRIPAEYWRDLIGAARRLDHPEITAELLTELHARAPSHGAVPGFAEDNNAYRDDTGGSTGDDEKTPFLEIIRAPKPPARFSTVSPSAIYRLVKRAKTSASSSPLSMEPGHSRL